MNENIKTTIKDVARYAGVSIGTVDRVVHNRGQVSDQTKLLVMNAIAKLEYKPNIHASLLSSGNALTIACLLPSYTKGDYWDKVNNGFSDSQEEFDAINVNIRLFLYDQYDVSSFKKSYEELLESNPSGVVLPPMFKSATIELVNILKERGIPYVYIDTKLEDENYLAYFGMPLYNSGYLGAHLLTDGAFDSEKDEIAIIRIHRDKEGQSDPMINRRSGFLDYIAENFPDCVMYNIFIDPEDEANINVKLGTFFKDHHNARFIVTFNSRIHLLASFLEFNHLSVRRVVGFDALDKNMDALRKGLVTSIITLHMNELPHQAVSCLVDFLRNGVRPSNKDHFLHMDILMKLNQEGYK